MVEYTLYWMLIVSVVNTEPYAPPLPEGRLATPDEMSAHINTKMLNSYRQMLLLTQFGLARLEADAKKGFDNRKAIEADLRIVADLKQRIEELEKRMQGPRPAPPPVLPDPRQKKPPVRD